MGKLFKLINTPLGEQKQIPLFYPFDVPDGAPVLCVDRQDGWSDVLYGGEVFTVQDKYLGPWA